MYAERMSAGIGHNLGASAAAIALDARPATKNAGTN
jgi:hypothetical protein